MYRKELDRWIEVIDYVTNWLTEWPDWLTDWVGDCTLMTVVYWLTDRQIDSR